MLLKSCFIHWPLIFNLLLFLSSTRYLLSLLLIQSGWSRGAVGGAGCKCFRSIKNVPTQIGTDLLESPAQVFHITLLGFAAGLVPGNVLGALPPS